MADQELGLQQIYSPSGAFDLYGCHSTIIIIRSPWAAHRAAKERLSTIVLLYLCAEKPPVAQKLPYMEHTQPMEDHNYGALY